MNHHSSATTVDLHALPPVFESVDELVSYASAFVNTKEWTRIESVINTNAILAQNSENAQQLLGIAAAGQSNYTAASFHFAKALSINPNYAEAAYYLGWAQLELGETANALRYLNQAIKLNPQNWDAMGKLALLLRDMNRPDLSLRWYLKLEEVYPEYDALENLIAIVYDAIGDEEKADEYYEKAFRRDPNNIAFLFNMIYRKTYSLESEVSKKIHELFERFKDEATTDAVNAYYTMGTLYDKHKQLDKAFDYYQKANQFQSRLVPSLIEEELKWTHDIMEVYTPSFVASPDFGQSGCLDVTPIFVIGMPRSSTSLTEQILACHPDVSGAGELELMRQITVIEVTKLSQAAYPQAITSLLPEHIHALGQHYINCLKTYGDSRYIVDKMPHNFFHVGLIRQMLPNAKIIHCVRDPIDTCWSIWRQIFYGRHTYKYDFDSLAQAYGNYQKMMAHWHVLFPDAIYDFCYEELLEAPEVAIRKLLMHCNLSWNESCLNFHETKRHVLTASTQQVRKPLYKSAVKSWEPVREQLTPLIQAMKKYDAIPARYLNDYQGY